MGRSRNTKKKKIRNFFGDLSAIFVSLWGKEKSYSKEKGRERKNQGGAPGRKDGHSKEKKKKKESNISNLNRGRGKSTRKGVTPFKEGIAGQKIRKDGEGSILEKKKTKKGVD